MLLPQDVYAPDAYTLVYPEFVTANIGSPVVAADNPLTVQGVSLGKKLFFDTRLSKDHTISCASCHGQQHSFDDSNQFSKGVGGTLGDRNAMPIVNLAWSNRFFWDGRRNSLETQAHDPVSNPVEMASKWTDVVATLQKDGYYPGLFFKAFGTRTIDSNLVTKAIAQFERTLISFNSRYDMLFYMKEGMFTGNEMKGFEAFNKFGCPSCHMDGLLTDGTFRNNGLDSRPADSGLAKFTHNTADYGKFKVPTLRNVAVTAPYMHDGRFKTLTEVMSFYAGSIAFDSPNMDSNMHQLLNPPFMTRTERDNIIAFLGTLTDSTFLRKMDFMNH